MITFIKQKPLRPSEKKKGAKQQFLGEQVSKKELKNLYGQNYKNDLLKVNYYIFEKDNNGQLNFFTKNTLDKVIVSKNLKSFRKTAITQNVKGEPNKKTYRQVFTHKTADNKQLVYYRDDVENLKNISPNSSYGVNIIHLDITLNISGVDIDKKVKIFPVEIQNIKRVLNIPLNNKITPQQINDIIETFLYGDENYGNGWLSGFSEFDGFKMSAFIQILNDNGKPQKLLNNGNGYYLYNDVRNYTNMHNFFNSININIPDGCNCVIETLKFLFETYITKEKKQIKIFKKELFQLEQKFKNNNEIPSFNKLIEFFETTATNYRIYNYTDKNDGAEHIFRDKNKIFNFLVYNQHLYLIDKDDNYNKIKNSLDTNDKYIVLSQTKFNEEINNLINDKTPPKIIRVEKERGTINADIISFENESETDKKVYIKDDKNKTNTNLLYLCQCFNIVYNPFITEGNIIDTIIKQTDIKQLRSFYLYNHKPRDIIYGEEIGNENPDNFITIDLNKYYSNLLMSIDEIPIINNLVHQAEKYNEGEEINDNYLYSIEIIDNNYNLAFKNDELYFGRVLNTEYYKPIFNMMVKEGKLKIIDKIKCEWVDNYYKPIIKKLFEIVEQTQDNNKISSTIKNIINFTIGKFQLSMPERIENFNNIHLEENNKVINYHSENNESYFNYNNNNSNYKLFYTSESKINTSYNTLENHRPLRNYIFNLSWLNILKFVNDNNIDENDIIQINIDSITIRNKKEKQEEQEKENEEFNNSYITSKTKKNKPKFNKDDEIYYNGKYNRLKDEINNFDENNKYKLQGVKLQQYKKKTTSNISPNNISFINDIPKHHNEFIINLGYAGIGKSYKINKLIQTLKEDEETTDQDDILIDDLLKDKQTDNVNNIIKDITEKQQKYILLAPLLKVLKLYPENINKNTVQHFTRNMKIPEENNIIIDEFYLINFKDFRHIINWLYKHNKNVYLFGDIYQLPPVDIFSNSTEKPELNIEFLETISTKFYAYENNDINHRNNFNLDVYNEFIKNDFTTTQQINLINYHINDMCDETKPFKIICYRNITKDKTNNEYLLKNNQTFFKDEKTNEINIKGLNIPLIAKKNYKINENIIINAKDDYILNVVNNKYIINFEDMYNKTVKFELEPEKIFKLFDVAYCLNLYNIQGQTLTNFKFILDDVYFLNNNNKFKISGAFYTLISRIKEELTDKKITIDDINIISNKQIKTSENIINNITPQNKEYNFGNIQKKTQTQTIHKRTKLIYN